MAGSEFATRIPLAPCGCGGRAIVWDRGSDHGDGSGWIAAWCSKHCGIGVSKHVYGGDRPYRTIGTKVVRIWNRAMRGRG